ISASCGASPYPWRGAALVREERRRVRESVSVRAAVGRLRRALRPLRRRVGAGAVAGSTRLDKTLGQRAASSSPWEGVAFESERDSGAAGWSPLAADFDAVTLSGAPASPPALTVEDAGTHRVCQRRWSVSFR